MLIKFSPQHNNSILSSVIKRGDALTINGVAYDFSPLEEGAVLPSEAINCEYISGSVKRVNGDIELTLLLPITATASEAARFPQPITVTTDGEVTLPC